LYPRKQLLRFLRMQAGQCSHCQVRFAYADEDQIPNRIKGLTKCIWRVRIFLSLRVIGLQIRSSNRLTVS
jgi:hypothetical protein